MRYASVQNAEFHLFCSENRNFLRKILPAGPEIFPENRRLDLAFPSNPGVTFAPRTEMTTWCGSLKGAKMEVNGSRGRLDRKLQKRNPWKLEVPNQKGHSWERETGQTTCKEVWFYLSGQTCRVGRIKPFFPVCLLGDDLFHLWTSGHTRLSASGEKEQRKRKIIWKAVKAPLWHKHKRNGPCLISLNCCLGVRQSPFLRLCGSRRTFVQNPFGRWCANG